MAKKILIVEDETNIRTMYSDILSESGFEMIEEGDGRAGELAVVNEEWDLLLLDIMLPKLDGVELLKRIKANNKTKAKPVIILTNLEDEQIKKTCLDLGANEFLVKSDIVPGDLVMTVNKYVLGE